MDPTIGLLTPAWEHFLDVFGTRRHMAGIWILLTPPTDMILFDASIDGERRQVTIEASVRKDVLPLRITCAMTVTFDVVQTPVGVDAAHVVKRQLIDKICLEIQKLRDRACGEEERKFI